MNLEIAILWEDGTWSADFYTVKENDESKATEEAGKVFNSLLESPQYKNAIGFSLLDLLKYKPQ